MRTGDHALLKELNQSIALNVLRAFGPMSRTDISKRTGLNKATISVIAEGFIASGLAVELGRGQSTVGRRPVLMQFNPQAGYAIGIEIELRYLRGVVTNLSGDIVYVHEDVVNHNGDVDATVSSIHQMLTRLMAHVPPSRLGLLGIGFGVPGLVNYAQGNVLNAPNLGWINVPLKQMLETEFDVPIFVDNEANTGALGEKSLAGRSLVSLVYISASIGIGTGIMLDGELVRGAGGLAGEFGHMVIDTNGPKCSCGSHGCLEVYASETNLTRTYETLSGQDVDIDDFYRRLHNGDPAAYEAISAVGRYLGIGIGNIVNALSPSTVIIGNRLAEGGQALLDAVLPALQAHCFMLPYAQTTVQLANLGRNGCAVGAAALVLHEYFSAPRTA